jgi:DtxR family transcriptional regulator, Mn-dependent transcriptional regulator
MKSTESREMYLEIIFDIDKSGDPIRSIDIANTLGYSKPSVNRAINILKQDGLVLQEPYGSITLTDQGRQMAKKIKKRHVLLTKFLRLCLNLDQSIAENDACRMEHILSDEAMHAIEQYVKDHQK